MPVGHFKKAIDPMKDASNLLLPFTPVAKTRLKLLFAVQALLAIVLWSISGSKSLPSPMEVLVAWVDLARNQGMLFELWGSIKISLKIA